MRTGLGKQHLIAAALLVLQIPFCKQALSAAKHEDDQFKGKDTFQRIVSDANSGHWKTVPIGELMGDIARELEGTAYVANTLELSADREYCSVNLNALDCVTFFESTLGLARMIKKGNHTPQDLLAEVTLTRYRHGHAGDYSTRLHYTTDWFADNQSKHVVEILSKLPGSEPFKQKVSLMSDRPESSIQLKAHPELVAKIKRDENAINSRSMTFVPLSKLAAVEPLLKTGDIVGITTSVPGLDITHTGIVFRTTDGVAHFMDASSRRGVLKVTIEPGPLSEALSKNKRSTGAMFARPLEP